MTNPDKSLQTRQTLTNPDNSAQQSLQQEVMDKKMNKVAKRECIGLVLICTFSFLVFLLFVEVFFPSFSQIALKMGAI